MVRPSAKHTSARLVLICVGLLGLALIADFLWASSPRFANSYISIASNWAPPLDISKPSLILTPKKTDDELPEKGNHKNDTAHGRVLSATFADLPGPELKWEIMAAAPVARLDGAAIQIKNLLFVFAGYGTIDYDSMGHSAEGPLPTHSCLILRQSSGGTCLLYQFLVIFRYAPATQLWRGRLHVMGGSKENRYTPGVDHWSLAVKDGKALEKEWRTEMPIPRGGPHRACIVVDDRLYLIGGQEGDFMAKPGSPIFKCSRRNEVVYGDVYMLDDEMKWKVLPPMPKPDSHIEFAWVVVNNSIVIVGGTTEKHPVTKKMTLVGEIFQFNLNTLNWSVLGKLPFRVKTTLVGFWNGWLYFTSGQRDKGPENPAPKKVIGELWRTKLKLSS
ncbi:kelch repeat-containing protein At3g27220 isoform X2 [Prunus dulcis]|uniref:kelch repeat-containing protein At3g27220 isoform X2 n=1 Tax=Prunus dulcis TaxID=3755 RepID=UPI00148381C0|nr:kelch repeat-containing protein At3g27220 isoform X2 [Prunus dulcis]